MAGTVIYTLCALTAFFCSFLLWQGYLRTRYNLLFWSGLCFSILTLNNILLVVDKIIFPTQVDLALPRTLTSLLGMSVFLYGLVFERKR